MYEWVCNEQKIQVQRQKHTPECSRGVLAHTGYQMSEQCRNLLSGPVTLFFLFLELKTGSGRPGINSLRTRLNPPSRTIRSKYVNPTSKITSLWNKLSLKKTSTSHLKVPEDPAVSIFKSHPNPKIFSVSETKESRNSFGSGSSYLNAWKQYLIFSTKKYRLFLPTDSSTHYLHSSCLHCLSFLVVLWVFLFANTYLLSAILLHYKANYLLTLLVCFLFCHLDIWFFFFFTFLLIID